MKKYLKTLKSRFIIFNIKIVVNLFTILYLLLQYKQNKRKNYTKYNNLYVCYYSCKKHFYLLMISILSLNNFIPNLHYVILDDGTITKFQKYLISQLNLNLQYISRIPNNITNKIKKLSYCNYFYKNIWSGKKFFFPLLFNSNAKCILIDSDTIFLSRPNKIIKWINNKTKESLYLKDYMNFVFVSPLEAEKISKIAITKNNLCCGFLCLNLKSFWANNSLKKINHYIEKIVDTIKSRMIRDYYGKPEFIYYLHLLEQTLFWITLNNTKLSSLNNKYQLLFNYNKGSNKKPIFIHFTPDNKEKSVYYKFLIYSLYQYIFKKNSFGERKHKPWFIYGSFENFRDIFLNSNKYLPHRENFFKKINLIIEK